jgi:hypothetical protein
MLSAAAAIFRTLPAATTAGKRERKAKTRDGTPHRIFDEEGTGEVEGTR